MGSRSARKRRRGAAWLALTLGAALLPVVGQAQTVEWARSAGGAAQDFATGIGIDAAGNSYVTGQFRETMTLGSFTPTSAGESDIFVAKYDSNGNVLWVRSGGGTSVDGGRSIAVDDAGNSYVTGFFIGEATFGSFTLTSAGGGSPDIFVIKYDTSGSVHWAQSAGSSIDDRGFGIAVDVDGNSYVTGFFQSTATFGSLSITSAGGIDIFVAKYDANGIVLWTRSAGGTSGDRGIGTTVDAAGNSFVTGRFTGTASFGTFPLTSAGDADIFVAKYDASGTVLWARQAGGTLFDFGLGVAVDESSNSYVTGRYQATATFGSFALTSAGNSDIFVAKYDASGSVLWARSAGGTSFDEGRSVVVDTAGNAYLTGPFARTATFGSLTLSAVGSFGLTDIFVVKYDAGGNALWARSAGGDLADSGSGIGVDAAGSIHVTGLFEDTANFGPFPLTSAGGQDTFVAKYNTCGNGSVDPGEECDGGLGCTDCLCDADFEPTAPPSLDCQPICGNGSVDPGEECDDGNTVDGDGCSSDCLREEACCLTDDSCQLIVVVSCAAQGGIAQGPGSTCGGTEACCDSATGACYTADRTCCLANGDSPQGPGTACTAPQECCFSNNTCTNLDPLCCVDQGGTPQGAGSTCGTCGDGTCDCDEDFDSCCQDCPCPDCEHCFADCSGGDRTCVHSCVTDCGDGTCDPACENCVTCEGDCACGVCTTCNTATATCDPDCGNGACQPLCGENCNTCSSDCGCESCDNCSGGGTCVSGCGDGACDSACEDCGSCPQDCHECGDGCCTASAGENCCNCTQDCGPCCGNGVCDDLCGEDCSTCPVDCQLPEGEECLPTMTEWGLMALVLLLLIGLAIKFGQYRRVPTDA